MTAGRESSGVVKMKPCSAPAANMPILAHEDMSIVGHVNSWACPIRTCPIRTCRIRTCPIRTCPMRASSPPAARPPRTWRRRWRRASPSAAAAARSAT
eukprot:3074332-Prymnesium_polylepis.1